MENSTNATPVKKAKRSKVLLILGIVIIAISIVVCFVLPQFVCLMNDCSKFREAGSEYCEFHTCRLEGCSEQKSKEKLYCGTHGCLADNCDAQNDTDTPYCSEHKCVVTGCEQEGKYSKNHCLYHICSLCGEPTNEYYDFCPECKIKQQNK